MARDPRSLRSGMRRMEAGRCRDGGQLLRHHGGHNGCYGRCARYINRYQEFESPPRMGRFFARVSSMAFAQTVNACVGRLLGVRYGYTPCVP